MPTKIRLQRRGKKKYAYFHIVIADSRAPRDGKFIEKIGTYNPNTNPATIELDFESALKWVKSGAQPTDTAKALLSYKGVLYKKHLDRGVLKGAFSQEEADSKFEKWLEEKESKINSKKEKLSAKENEELKKRLEAEKEANKKKAEILAAKNAALAPEVTEEEPAAEETPEAAAPETVEKAVEEKKEPSKEEAKKAPEAAAEKPAEEKKEPAKEEADKKVEDKEKKD